MNMDNSILLQEINTSLKEQNDINKQILGVMQDINERLLVVIDQTAPKVITVSEGVIKDIKPLGNATTSKVTTATKTVIKK